MITLMPISAKTMDDLTGFVDDDSILWSRGDRLVMEFPNGDHAHGTLTDFYGVGRIAGIGIQTDHFGRMTYHWGNGDQRPAYRIWRDEA